MAASHLASILHRWRRVAAALLVGVLCMQVVPMQLLRPAAPAHHECAERGFCPRNPGGPCTCNHHGAEAGHDPAHPSAADTHGPQTPVMQQCGSPAAAPLMSQGLVKGVLAAAHEVTAPPSLNRWHESADSLTPQQRGADIFRPPKVHLG